MTFDDSPGYDELYADKSPKDVLETAAASLDPLADDMRIAVDLAAVMIPDFDGSNTGTKVGVLLLVAKAMFAIFAASSVEEGIMATRGYCCSLGVIGSDLSTRLPPPYPPCPSSVMSVEEQDAEWMYSG